MPDYLREELITELKRRRDPRSRAPIEKEYPAYEGQTGQVYDTGESSYTPIYQPRETYDPIYIDSIQGPKLQEARGLRRSEPNVPEWAGKYPNVYGVVGAAREAVQPFMRGSLVDVGLSKAVGYPTPEFMTEKEQMGLPVMGGLFSKAATVARPQVWIRQHPQSGQFVAQQGMGAEGRILTSGKTIEDVMKRARELAPGHDIKTFK